MSILDFLNKDTWTQGSMAVDANGIDCEADDPKACRWCLMGALHKAYDPNERENAKSKLYDVLNQNSIIHFNDNHGWSAVEDAIRKAGV